MKFSGFQKPQQNYSKLPHSLIDSLPEMETMAEIKVVLYLLRHTWGFSEFDKPKKLTTDEFCNGRKKRDQSRMDNGTGLSENSVRSGLEKAVEHGFIIVETDDSDKARIEKWYCLNMDDSSESEVGGANIEGLGAEVAERSEKETIERKEMNAIIESGQRAQTEHNALIAFEAAFKIENGNIPWHKNRPEWTRLRKKLVEKYQSDPEYFKKYLIWYNEAGKFAGGMNVQQLRRDPDGFVLALNIFDATQTVGIPQKSAMLEETQKKIESEDWRKRA